MGKKFGMLLLLVLRWPTHNVIQAQGLEKKVTVLLDPGHGGTDSGAMGTNGMLEKDLTLQIVQEIICLNKELDSGQLDLYQTRYSDTLIALGDRSRLAKGLQAALFISIHGNHAPNSKAQGLEVFVWPPYANAKNPFGQASKDLARELASELQQKLGLKNRGIKKANFQVLRDNHDTCPSILLELGFLSNSEEAEYLKNPSGISGLALAILLGVIKFLDHGAGI